MMQALLGLAFILEVVLLLLGGFCIYLGDWKRREKKPWRYNTSWQYNIFQGIFSIAVASRALIATINYL